MARSAWRRSPSIRKEEEVAQHAPIDRSLRDVAEGVREAFGGGQKMLRYSTYVGFYEVRRTKKSKLFSRVAAF